VYESMEGDIPYEGRNSSSPTLYNESYAQLVIEHSYELGQTSYWYTEASYRQ